MELNRYIVRIKGIVQGVGFRPFIYTLAKSLSLKGFVKNISGDVLVELDCSPEDINLFLKMVRCEAPPISVIKEITVEQTESAGFTDLEIIESEREAVNSVFISPDIGLCDKCRIELQDGSDRRYMYPFINCTNCGPRFTIIKGIPYDRSNTTMDNFVMCDKCLGEYGDPLNRRYHAQPISCHECGPRLTLTDCKGVVLAAGTEPSLIESVKKILADGRIIAMKGLGGYHLVCNARDAAAVQSLRQRKIRDYKPFAVMVKDYSAALKYCYINNEEKLLLESDKKPIVLLEKRKNNGLPEDIAPGNPCLGVMLPYTPLHYLFFTKPDLEEEILVVTSGNRSSEPIYYKDEDAFENLQGIADYFLVNDREIYIRTDDSVTRIFNGDEYIIRRSRGYVPLPVSSEVLKKLINGERKIPSVLACGGELKSTFCLNKANEFYISHHIGDLENAETLMSYEDGIEHFKKLFEIEYSLVAHDLHPDYLSTKYALEAATVKKVAVQHHHAHIASCMVENGLEGDVIGVAFDGTGYGEDGRLWGGEFFTGSYRAFNREGHLNYIRMPGGDRAVKEPWRMALSYLNSAFGDADMNTSGGYGIFVGGTVCLDSVEVQKINAVRQILNKGINSPMTSSMGRLFDAVSAIIGIKSTISYEGQAAIELEFAADKGFHRGYAFSLTDQKDGFIINTDGIIKGIVEDLIKAESIALISAKFHESAANIVLEGCRAVRDKTGLNRAVLSGGVFQNMLLLQRSISKLKEDGFETYIHSKVPANDGGISLGQAVIAIAREMDN